MSKLTRVSLNASHIIVTDKSIQRAIVAGAWEFMTEAYRWVPGGFLSFADEADMVEDSYVWFITYDGPAPNLVNLDWNHVYCCTICKQNHGLKAVAFGRQGTASGKAALADPRNQTASDVDFRTRRSSALGSMMRYVAQRCWAEVSGKPEVLFKSMGAPMVPVKTVIDSGAFGGKQIMPEPDGYHYQRLIGNKLCTKVVVGNGFKA